MTFTSTDCNTAWMANIACFSPGIGSPSTAFSATLSISLTAASGAEYGEVQELSASVTGTAGERGCMSRFISRSNEKSGDPIQNIIYVEEPPPS